MRKVLSISTRLILVGLLAVLAGSLSGPAMASPLRAITDTPTPVLTDTPTAIPATSTSTPIAATPEKPPKADTPTPPVLLPESGSTGTHGIDFMPIALALIGLGVIGSLIARHAQSRLPR
jgi:hypothetical protein